MSSGKLSLENPNVIYADDRFRGELDFMCTVEWSWSPYHQRIDSYFLGLTDTEVELWSQYNDESTGQENWCCCVVADKTSNDAQAVAASLLEFLWRHESAESAIGVFDMVSDEGLLEQDAVFQIGESVWPE